MQSALSRGRMVNWCYLKHNNNLSWSVTTWLNLENVAYCRVAKCRYIWHYTCSVQLVGLVLIALTSGKMLHVNGH